ncbi:RNA-binding protein [Candidatus Woesearchaeota archaeon]|nr:RNA-binding protein [Candidatus Woesearchaeota archaeon]
MSDVTSVLKVQSRDVVVPGEVLAVGMDYLPSFGTYRSRETIRAARLGLVTVEGKVLKLIPLSGAYLPKRGDMIIAKVIDILMSGWRVDTNSPYSAVLQLKDASSGYIEKGADLTKYFALGDYVSAIITNVTSQKLVDVSMREPGARKIIGGRIIEVSTNKVPRIIGKQGSMVSLIKEATGCKITVGQNGLVWLEGHPLMENLAVETIRKIEKEGHISGMTDKIKAFLDSRLKETKHFDEEQ